MSLLYLMHSAKKELFFLLVTFIYKSSLSESDLRDIA